MANRIRITAKLQAVFIGELRKHGNVTRAAETIKKTRGAVYEFRGRREDFATAWDEAIESFMDGVETEAIRRGTVGVQKPVYFKGAIVGHVTEYSDRLLEFILDRRRYPQKQRHEVTGKEGGPIIMQAEPHDDTL
jgi:trehalose utilization protein